MIYFTAFSCGIRIHKALSSRKGCIALNLNRFIMAPPNGYGALSNSTASNRPDAHGPIDEEQALLGPPVPKSGWRMTMMVDVNRDRADVVLLMCYIITGLLDSASISTWGSFVSMQTGSFKTILSYVTA